MNTAILRNDVQQFINENLHADTTRLLLQKSRFETITTAELVTQIDSKNRCEKKLPLWYHTSGICYPVKLSVEQASSQATAVYKSGLIKGKNLADLTGGFGVDSYFFSLVAEEVTYCETDAELYIIAKHNAAQLNAENIVFVNTNGINYLSGTSVDFDTVYIDPSRRINAQKVFKLRDCEPDVVNNLDMLLKKSGQILLKTAPLLDIQSGLKELHHVGEIHVVSLKNDCKELLWIIEPGFKDPEPVITCVGLNDHENQIYRFRISEEKAETISNFSEPLQYIYEPDVALLKAGCFKLIARDFEVLKLHPNTHVYTSITLKNNFFGRKFRLTDSWTYKIFSKTIPVRRANIICRNFPISAAEVKSKHKLKDGGNEFLIFTRGPQEELLVLWCERL